MEISLRQLRGDSEVVEDLQRVLEEAPNYSLITEGAPVSPDDAKKLMEALPVGKSSSDKFVMGIYLHDQLVGVIDLIRGWPFPDTVHLGLLLLSEKHQCKGYGKNAYQKVEELLDGWTDIQKIRIGIIAANNRAIPFWERLGFRRTGERNPYHSEKLRSETLYFEKGIKA